MLSYLFNNSLFLYYVLPVFSVLSCLVCPLRVFVVTHAGTAIDFEFCFKVYSTDLLQGRKICSGKVPNIFEMTSDSKDRVFSWFQRYHGQRLEHSETAHRN